MSETSIAQEASTEAEEVRTTWYFTFGGGHVHPATGDYLSKAYVVIVGTRDEARTKMEAAFGNRWAFQYATYDDACIDEYDMHQVDMPEPAAEAESKSTVETADPEVIAVPDPDRVAYTQGLREIADWLDAHPEVRLPYIGRSIPGCELPALPIYLRTPSAWEDVPSVRAQMATVARAMGSAAKSPGLVDGTFIVWRSFAGLAVFAQAERDEVCERIVVGTKEVTEEIPDPEVLKSVPKVTVTKTVEEVEWRCGSLLSPEPKQLAVPLAEVAA